MEAHRNWFDVPIATAPASWLRSYLGPRLRHVMRVGQIARIRRKIGFAPNTSAIVWIPTDSEPEGSWILGHADLLLRHSGASPLVRCDVPPEDPTLAWEDALGFLDGPSIVCSNADVRAVGLVGGNWIPAWSFVHHLPAIRALATGLHSVVLIPVARETFNRPGVCTPADAVVSVPSLRDATPEDVEALLRAMLDRELDEFGLSRSMATESPLREEIAALVHQRPQSRTAAALWARRCAARVAATLDEWGDSGVGLGPLQLASVQEEPSGILSLNQLSVRFDACMATLANCSRRFESTYGRALFWEHQQLPGPFDARDPWHWFIWLVTRCYCTVLDYPAREGLAVIATSFRIDPTSGNVVREPLDDFAATVSALRTRYQHGVNDDDPKNREKADKVREWLLRVVGATRVERKHGRRLAEALLAEFESFVARVAAFVDVIPDEMLKSSVALALAEADARVPEIELARGLDRAVRRMASPLTPEALLRKHGAELRRRINGCCLRGEALREKVEAECEVVVLAEMAARDNECPIDGKWLVNEGVPQGAVLGEILRLSRTEWERIAQPRDREAFLRWARCHVRNHLSQSGSSPQ